MGAVRVVFDTQIATRAIAPRAIRVGGRMVVNMLVNMVVNMFFIFCICVVHIYNMSVIRHIAYYSIWHLKI